MIKKDELYPKQLVFPFVCEIILEMHFPLQCEVPLQ